MKDFRVQGVREISKERLNKCQIAGKALSRILDFAIGKTNLFPRFFDEIISPHRTHPASTDIKRA
jgi:hypothetical protein